MILVNGAYFLHNKFQLELGQTFIIWYNNSSSIYWGKLILQTLSSKKSKVSAVVSAEISKPLFIREEEKNARATRNFWDSLITFNLIEKEPTNQRLKALLIFLYLVRLTNIYQKVNHKVNHRSFWISQSVI